MKIWNVRVPVGDLVPAETAEQAISKLSSRLADDDYQPYTVDDEGDAFESEALDAEIEAAVLDRYRPYR